VAEIVNLTRARKAAKRRAAQLHAAENRVRFGLGKEERRKERAEAEKAAKEFADKKLE
jgi:hypothetical protein